MEFWTLLRSSVYYPCYVSSTVSTWTCSVCSLSYLVAHLMIHPVKIWVRQSELDRKVKLWGSLKWHFVVNSAFCLGFAYRAVTIWQVGILHVACIRERGSVLYLGMATEILNLTYFCITQIMAKEATNPKPSMQREWYCLAVHKYIRERTFEYAGAEKQTADKVEFRHLLSSSSSSSSSSSFFFLIQNSWLA